MRLKFRSGQITFAFQFCLLSWLGLHEEPPCSHRRGFTWGMSSQEHTQQCQGTQQENPVAWGCQPAFAETVQRVQTDLQISYAFPNHNSKYSDNYPWLDKYCFRHSKPVRLAWSGNNHQFHVCLGHLNSHLSLKLIQTQPLCPRNENWDYFPLLNQVDQISYFKPELSFEW